MKTFGALLLVFASFPAFALPTGFEIGNVLTIQNLSGNVIVQCQEQGFSSSRYFHCDGRSVTPGMAARFVTDAGGNADTVELTATHADGKTAYEKEAFDPVRGLSKDRFNLAISTLFQHPLLGLGKNQVHFQLTAQGKTEREGDFEVLVTQDPTWHECETGSLFETGGWACNDQYQACRHYFDADPTCR